MVSVTWDFPPEFSAVTTYCAAGTVTVEVLLTLPVVGSRVNPAGSAGEIDQLITAPPVLLGIIGVDPRVENVRVVLG